MGDVRKILITGITGFVGSHLAEYIFGLNQGHEVYGLCRWRSPRDNIRNIYNQIMMLEADLFDLGGMIRHLDTVRPDVIFHLAAQSYVLTSFNTPVQTLWTNVIGTTNLLEAVRILRIDPVIHICSSSEVYGQVGQEDIPIKETCPFRPASPYAVSKVGEDMVAYQYWVSYAMSFFGKQIAAAELGLREPVVSVGNLQSVRTFCDVRDAVEAYWLLVTKCPPGEVYNIGGNRTLTIGEALDIMLSYSKTRCEVRVDPKLLRPSDVTLQIPCIDKFRNETGWTPKIRLEKTLSDILDYWRQELSRNPWKAVTVIK
jgi:GDP-D-mannose dehydratase